MKNLLARFFLLFCVIFGFYIMVILIPIVGNWIKYIDHKWMAFSIVCFIGTIAVISHSIRQHAEDEKILGKYDDKL